mmetsp:Transcript_116251/g.335801  ORF Transcript_116251/g.335801 Transcript_116251/m.335801 type:complete len:281 (+) Transcript_116251:411-1253(+)
MPQVLELVHHLLLLPEAEVAGCAHLRFPQQRQVAESDKGHGNGLQLLPQKRARANHLVIVVLAVAVHHIGRVEQQVVLGLRELPAQRVVQVALRKLVERVSGPRLLVVLLYRAALLVEYRRAFRGRRGGSYPVVVAGAHARRRERAGNNGEAARGHARAAHPVLPPRTAQLPLVQRIHREPKVFDLPGLPLQHLANLRRLLGEIVLSRALIDQLVALDHLVSPGSVLQLHVHRPQAVAIARDVCVHVEQTILDLAVLVVEPQAKPLHLFSQGVDVELQEA